MGKQIAAFTVDPACSIERTLGIVGERWTFLILREALLARSTKFTEFTEALRIAPNILTDRLTTLVNAGLLEKQMYKPDGERARASYHPTDAGEQLKLVLAALQQWGDDHVPRQGGAAVLRRTKGTNRPVRLAFVDDRAVTHEISEIAFLPAST